MSSNSKKIRSQNKRFSKEVASVIALKITKIKLKEIIKNDGHIFKRTKNKNEKKHKN